MRRTTGIILFTLLVAIISLPKVGKASITSVPSHGSINTPRPGTYDYERSLQELEKTIPLPYNEPVKRMINYYASSQKGRFSKVLGLSQYYFPIYEKIFKERGVPEEIKYLSIVESSLNPYATSTAQAGGLWQFLTPVGKIYGLTINDTIDERRDPVLACNAAASYLLDSYAMYKDWLLAIASYNCGRNNIRWAMEKAGGATDYWGIREFLPVETQNYVPAYIATLYLMNNGRKHGIYPKSPDFSIYTKEITVKRPVSLFSISKATGIQFEELALLNASYKDQVIYGSQENPRKLVLPVIKTYIHDALAVVLQEDGALQSELKLVYTIPVEEKQSYAAVQKVSKYKASDTYVQYRVQDGDTLSSIAEKFEGATEEEIKIINRLKHYSVKPGMILKIIQG